MENTLSWQTWWKSEEIKVSSQRKTPKYYLFIENDLAIKFRQLKGIIVIFFPLCWKPCTFHLTVKQKKPTKLKKPFWTAHTFSVGQIPESSSLHRTQLPMRKQSTRKALRDKKNLRRKPLESGQMICACSKLFLLKKNYNKIKKI